MRPSFLHLLPRILLVSSLLAFTPGLAVDTTFPDMIADAGGLYAKGRNFALYEKSAALISIAEGFAKLGAQPEAQGILEQVLKLAGRMPEQEDSYDNVQSRALAKVAIGYVRNGDLAAARGLVPGIVASYWKTAANSEIAPALARNGDLEAALALVEMLEDDSREDLLEKQSEVLAQIVNELARQGNFEQALRLAGKVQQDCSKLANLTAIAKGIATQRNLPESEKMIQQLIQLPKSFSTPSMKADSALQLASILTESGYPTEAGRLLEQTLSLTLSSLSTNTHENSTQSQASCYLSVHHRLEEKAYGLIPIGAGFYHNGNQARARQVLAQAYAQAGKLIPDDGFSFPLNPPPQIQIMLTMVQAGDLDAALGISSSLDRLVLGVEVVAEKAIALAKLARVLSEQGDRKQARQYFKQAVDSLQKLETAEFYHHLHFIALTDIAAEMAGAAEYDWASRLLEQALSLTPPENDWNYDYQVQFRVAEVMVACRKPARARQILEQAYSAAHQQARQRQIESPEFAWSSPDQQNDTLTALAKAFAKAGDRTRASQLLAEGLALLDRPKPPSRPGYESSDPDDYHDGEKRRRLLWGSFLAMDDIGALPDKDSLLAQALTQIEKIRYAESKSWILAVSTELVSQMRDLPDRPDKYRFLERALAIAINMPETDTPLAYLSQKRELR